MRDPQVSVIVLAYGAEPLLGSCVSAALGSMSKSGEPLDLEVIVVDNGAAEAVSALTADPRLRIVTMAENTGFTGGCNAGAELARGNTLVFVNSDAVCESSAIGNLADALDEPNAGLVCGSVRLADAPDTINSVGNPVHFLGVVWAGGMGEPATAHSVATDVATVTGCFFAAKRDTWRALGGFAPSYFAYHEDAELSLRAWQMGLRVRLVPEAVVLHHYEFHRNPRKMHLVERNRWQTILTVYPAGLLAAVLPALILFELPVLLAALAQGWLPGKLSSYAWLLRNRSVWRQRRAEVQARSTLSSAEFAELLTGRFTMAAAERPPGLAVLNALASAYWRAVRVLVRSRHTGLSHADI